MGKIFFWNEVGLVSYNIFIFKNTYNVQKLSIIQNDENN